MMFDYNRVQSVSREEFEAGSPPLSDLEDPSKFTKADTNEVAKMERLLDVREGTLGEGHYLEVLQCPRCSRLLTMYDWVVTAIVDADHPKSFILHTMVGSKRVVSARQPIRCSVCAEKVPPGFYMCTPSYRCGI